MWGAIDRIINNAKSLNEKDAWLFVIDKEVKDEIIRLNTQEQLFDEGIDSLNRTLGDYTPYTVVLKKAKGQRTDHITLKDTGAFYNSFKVQVTSTGIIIQADDSSIYDIPLTKSFGLDILGLTNDNILWLFDYLDENYNKYVRKKLFQ
tara:strand:- start:1819 stop:2262 length:444 start_codon:yes stop_codon:yes gene_type:complete